MDDNKKFVKDDRKQRNPRGKGKRGRKLYKKDTKDVYQRQEESGKPEVHNNANMYFTNPVLAEQVSNFSFNQFLGSYEGVFNEVEGIEGDIPEFMRIYLNPSPGWLDGNVAEGINAVAMKTYTKLSAGNAKTTNYAPQDISTLILAFGEIISMVTFLRRALGVIYTYNPRNRAMPLGLVRVMGINAEELLTHVADSRMHLNAIINQINSIPIPSYVGYFKKCREVYEHIYSDSESPMAQYYVTTPYSTWVLDEQTYEQGSILRTVPVDNSIETQKSFEDYLEILQDQVNALLGSSTYNYIYSDILRLGNLMPTYNMPLVPADYVVMPEYNPMALLQIHNSRPIMAPKGTELTDDNTPANDVYPDVNKNALVFKPLFDLPTMQSDAFVINFLDSLGNPDLDQRVDVTRYTCTFNRDTGRLAIPDHYVVQELAVSMIGGQPTAWTAAPAWGFYNYDYFTTTANAWTAFCTQGYLDAFNYAPITYTCGWNENDRPKVNVVNADLCYFTTLDYKYLRRVNDLTMMGLFEVREKPVE